MNMNLFTMIDAYYKNQDAIRSYFGKKEHFQEIASPAPAKTILGFAIGTFLILILLNIVIYIWAIIALIKYWNKMNVIAVIASVLFLFSGFGGVVSLLIIYITKSD